MKIVNGIKICSLCLVLVACNTGHNEVVPINFEQESVIAASDSIDIERFGILNPSYIVSSEDSIWIVDDGGTENLVYLLSASGQYQAKGISVGNGPDEVLEVTSIRRVNGSTVIYDGRKGIVSKVEREGDVLHLRPLATQLRMLDDAVVLPDETILTLPVAQGYSYGLLDGRSILLDSIRYYPDKPDGVSDFTHALACTGFLAVTPDGRRLARALVYDGGIDFFMVADTSIAHVSRVESFGMEYDVLDVGQQVPTVSPATCVGYRSLVASKDKFYALYSDVRALEWTGGFSEVQAFTVDGAPFCKYLLDNMVSRIAVAPDNATLYGVGTEQGEKIFLFVFRLP